LTSAAIWASLVRAGASMPRETGAASSWARRVKLAIVSGLLRHYPRDLALAKLRDAGCAGVELWVGHSHA
jgi:hypothetical protein